MLFKRATFDYSCGQCKNRLSKKCEKCFHLAGKIPTKFKLDKSASAECQFRMVDGAECSLLHTIRELEREAERIEAQLKTVESIDAHVIQAFVNAVHPHIRYVDAIRTAEENEHVLNVVGRSFRVVSCKDLIETLSAINDRENKIIELTREKSEIEEKIKETKRILGIK